MDTFKDALLLFFFVAAMHLAMEAQPDPPRVNGYCPDFYLTDVHYYKDDVISLGHLKGKPFILDFFSAGCTSCFSALPKVNELNRIYGDQVQFVMIGKDNRRQGPLIRRAYERFREKYGLNLPVAYDSAIISDFQIPGFPHVIWVDRDGRIQAISTTNDLNAKNLEAFIAGKTINFQDYSRDGLTKQLETFDENAPFLVNGNGGDEGNFIQRSLIGRWEKGMPSFGLSTVSDYESRNVPLQILGWPLENLYRMAFFGRLSNWGTRDTTFYGKYHYSPILEIKDSSLFLFDWKTTANRFCYSQVIPKEKMYVAAMMEIMQRDLKNFFGYDVRVEERMMPVLKLRATSHARKKLRTKGGEQEIVEYIGGGHYNNAPIKSLINHISYSANLVSRNMPLVDETAIGENIDLSFEAPMTDFTEIKRVLHAYGLEFVPGTAMMKVIVISDDK